MITVAHDCHIQMLTANYKSLTANCKLQLAHSKFKSLTANSNRSQRIKNHSQQIINCSQQLTNRPQQILIAHTKFKSPTANSNRSQQIKVAHSKFKSLPFCQGWGLFFRVSRVHCHFTKGKPNYQIILMYIM